jgi:outer membrane protein assembly factor BamE
MQKLLIYLIVFASLSLSGCSLDMLTIYKIDVQQGNALDQADIDRIRPGMDKRQVEFVLGKPLLTDPFHADRWDYVFFYKPGYTDPSRARFTLWFEDNKVARMEQNGMFEDPDRILEQSKTW